MKTKTMSYKQLYILGAVSILSACGGGGGSESSAPSGLNTGRFIDSPVKGISYETETQSGVTNADGEFKYKDGEIIRFSLGGIYLGASKASDVITPFDLMGTRPLDRESDIISTLKSTSVTGFDRAINIATLLQALDTDGQPENGIDLANSRSQLAQLPLNFSVKATTFGNQDDFNAILATLGIDNPPSLEEVATHLYDTLDIEVESKLVASTSTTENNVKAKLVRYTYNDNDQVLTQETDFEQDGVIDQVLSYSYDGNNQLIRLTDSRAQTVETRTYDANGNMLSKTIDHPTISRRSRQSFSYDQNLLTTLETDLRNDGSIDITISYEYDSTGQPITQTTSYGDPNTPNTTTRYTYSDGQLDSVSEDSNSDGNAESSISYRYDANGNILDSTTTRVFDGKTQTSTNRFEYSDSNHPTRYQRDIDQDGQADLIEAYKHDSQGQRTEYRKDLDADGSWDFLARYEYDHNGNRTRMIEDSDGNGIVDKVWEAQYQTTTLTNPWAKISSQL